METINVLGFVIVALAATLVLWLLFSFLIDGVAKRMKKRRARRIERVLVTQLEAERDVLLQAVQDLKDDLAREQDNASRQLNDIAVHYVQKLPSSE